MEIRKLTLEDIKENLLADFERYEIVKQAWRNEKGELALKDIFYTEDWDEEHKGEKCKGLAETCLKGGSVLICREGHSVIGFASVENEPFGSSNQYLNLSMLHVTKDYRGKGLGKLLFMKCAEEAKNMGAKKLYISASSSKNAQRFYRGMGCCAAEEINARLQELEPYDIQMEYKLELL